MSGSPFSEDDVIKSGPFKLNLRAREVLKNGVKIELTQIEYGLLKAFMQNIGKALRAMSCSKWSGDTTMWAS